MSTSKTTRILLADDHRMLRDGLRALLHSQRDMELVAEAEDGRSAVRLAQDLTPDVVLMDIAMPDLDGVAATRLVRRYSPKTKVIILSCYTDHDTANEAIHAGAKGLVPKDSAFEELALAIRTVLTGATYLSPRLPHDIVLSVLGTDGNS